MKLVIFFNFFLITVVVTAPHKRARRKSQRYDELNSNYESYQSTDICNNIIQTKRNQVECRNDAQTISLKVQTDLGSISVAKSFSTTNTERKHPKRPYLRRYQGETYKSDANSFSTNINLPHTSFSFTKSYSTVSGC